MATLGTQNTVTFVNRHKYFQNGLQQVLRNALVSEAIFKTDRTDLKTIENPYISTQATLTQQAVAGTYSPAAYTTTEDFLTVADEIIVPTHVYDFESRFANFNLVADFLDDMMYQVANRVDVFVLNKMLSLATGTYTTPAGGFTTPSNIPVICSNLLSKVAGYAGGLASNPFLVIESTDIVGFAQAQVSSGFNYADAALRNGLMTNYMGIDIYVVRTGTFQTATLGTLSATNSGRRMFGLKNLGLFAAPRGTQYEEKAVSGKTGKEIVAYTYVGAKIWANHAPLFVNITIA